MTVAARDQRPWGARGGLVQSDRSDPLSPVVRAGGWVVIAAAFVGVVVLLDAAARRAIVPNSDAASLVLEGQSINGGHFLLAGWTLSLDSFWTSEVPFYALGEVVLGVHPVLLSLVPAILAALVVVFGVLIARDARRGAPAAAAGLTVVALLVFPTHPLAFFFLSGGAHIGATLGALIAFYALRRNRWDIGVVVAVVVLSAGMLGDLLEFAYGTAPVFLAGVTVMARRRSWRIGLPAEVTALAACALSIILRLAAVAVGTFGLGAPLPIATWVQVKQNLRHIYSLGGELLGWRSNLLGAGGLPDLLQGVHTLGAAVVVMCVGLALIRLALSVVLGKACAAPAGTTSHERPVRWWQSEPQDGLLDDLLAVACFGSAIAYLLLASYNAVGLVRYLTPSAVFVVVLAGRVMARAWSRPVLAGVRRVLGVTGVVVVACFAAGFGYTVIAPRPAQPAAQLGAWLQQHDLTSGIGTYWAASITTVQSQDRVKIRPVIAASNGHLVRYDRESDAAWYTRQEFRFLVFLPGAPWGDVDLQSAEATFGPPAQSDAVDGYQVLVWRHPFTIASTNGTVLPPPPNTR